MSKHPTTAELWATLRLLAERFPLAFKVFDSPKVPLKIGIDQDIRDALPDVPKKQIKVALQHYCGWADYLASITEGAVRVDLAGNAAGVVTADEERYAIERWLIATAPPPPREPRVWVIVPRSRPVAPPAPVKQEPAPASKPVNLLTPDRIAAGLAALRASARARSCEVNA